MIWSWKMTGQWLWNDLIVKETQKNNFGMIWPWKKPGRITKFRARARDNFGMIWPWKQILEWPDRERRRENNVGVYFKTYLIIGWKSIRIVLFVKKNEIQKLKKCFENHQNWLKWCVRILKINSEIFFKICCEDDDVTQDPHSNLNPLNKFTSSPRINLFDLACHTGLDMDVPLR